MQVAALVAVLLASFALCVVLQAGIVRRTRARHPELWVRSGRPPVIALPFLGDPEALRRLLWKEDLGATGDSTLRVLALTYRMSLLLFLTSFALLVIGGLFGWISGSPVVPLRSHPSEALPGSRVDQGDSRLAAVLVGLFAVVVGQLAAVRQLCRKLKSDHSEKWESLGQPDLGKVQWNPGVALRFFWFVWSYQFRELEDRGVAGWVWAIRLFLVAALAQVSVLWFR